MTSKISFPKLLKEDLKKRTWLPAVSVVIFMVIIPLLMLSQIDGQLASVEIAGKDLEIVKDWFSRMVGLDNLIIVPVMIGAVISGITSFSYLHSKSQTDFYHSLPIKREMWFSVSYVGSLIQVIVPYIAGYVILFAAGSVKGVTRPEMLAKAPYVLFVVTLFYLLVYSVTILAMMITGKMIVALFGVFVFLFYGSSVAALKIYIMTQGFETYVTEGRAYGFVGNLFGEAGWLSPILAYMNFTEQYADGVNQTKTIIVFIICILLFSALAFVLYRMRPSEAAGKAIAFPKMEAVIKVIIAVTAGIFFGVIAGSQNRTSGMNAGWLFGIGILSSILVCAVIEFIYHTDMKLICKKKLSLLAAVFGTTAILASVQYDVFGYNTYFPEKEKLEAMALHSVMASNNWASADYSDEREYKEVLRSLRVEEFDLIYELAANGLERVGTEPGQTGTYVTIAYYLKDGKEVYRSYWVDEEMFSKCMEKLTEDTGYREELFGLSKLKLEKVRTYQFNNFEQEEINLKLTKEQKEKLLETYKQEVLSQPLSVFKDEGVIGELDFGFGEEADRFDRYFRGNVYKEFKDLRKLLEEYGYPVQEKIQVEDVYKIYIRDYREEREGLAEITDPMEIQKVLDKVYYKQGEKTEQNVYVEVEFKDSHYGTYYMGKK